MDKLEQAMERRAAINALLWAVRDVDQGLPTVAEYKRIADETDAEIDVLRRGLDGSLG